MNCGIFVWTLLRGIRFSPGKWPYTHTSLVAQSWIRPFKVPLFSPPMAEQKQIVAHIMSAIQTLPSPIDRYEREMQLLREYPTRLVSDVVTGILDVRETAAVLPGGFEAVDDVSYDENGDIEEVEERLE